MPGGLCLGTAWCLLGEPGLQRGGAGERWHGVRVVLLQLVCPSGGACTQAGVGSRRPQNALGAPFAAAAVPQQDDCTARTTLWQHQGLPR